MFPTFQRHRLMNAYDDFIQDFSLIQISARIQSTSSAHQPTQTSSTIQQTMDPTLYKYPSPLEGWESSEPLSE